MKRGAISIKKIEGVGLCLGLLAMAGCATQAQTGAVTGAGVGALMGQIIGGNTAGTLIGAGVGTGVGYIIGNELDKNAAMKRQQVMMEETRPLAGTTWQVVSTVPKPRHSYKSLVSHFRPDGTVISTKTFWDDKVETDIERYRIVGSTLIINKPDYVINARFRLEGNRMYMDTDKYSIVLQRVD